LTKLLDIVGLWKLIVSEQEKLSGIFQRIVGMKTHCVCRTTSRIFKVKTAFLMSFSAFSIHSSTIFKTSLFLAYNTFPSSNAGG